MTFDPMSVEVTRVTLSKDHCVQVPWQYINVCGYSDQFCKILHTTYYVHTTYVLRTYYIHTTYRMSDHIVSYWTQFRWDKKQISLNLHPTLFSRCVNLDPIVMEKRWADGESWPNDFVEKVNRGEDLRWEDSRWPLTHALITVGYPYSRHHHLGRTLPKFTQLKRNKRFDNFIMLVWVQGSPFHIAAGSHPVQEAWGSQDSLYRGKFKSCFNVVENHTNRFLLL